MEDANRDNEIERSELKAVIHGCFDCSAFAPEFAEIFFKKSYKFALSF
jgi:hypothetical protein